MGTNLIFAARHTFRFIYILMLVLIATLSGQTKQSRYSFYINDSQITLDPYGQLPSFIRFREGSQPEVSRFFEEFRKAFSFSPDNEMKVYRVFTDRFGFTHHRYAQYYKGVEVLGAQFILHEKEGLVYYANGQLAASLQIDVTPQLSEKQALAKSLEFIGAEVYMWESPGNESFIKIEQNNPNATFYPQGELKLTAGHKDMLGENFRLVYRFDVYAETPRGRYFVDVDAQNGEIFSAYNRIHDADVAGTGTSLYNGTVDIIVDSFAGGFRLREASRGGGIQTFDMQNGTNYAAAVDFVDPDANFTDPNAQAGVSAHWGGEATYDYFLNEHGRDSYDGAGGMLLSYAHFGINFNNAFWDGSRMTYGDGDGVVFTPLVSLDVVGHELTHGVTEFSANLIYANEPGALNESFSDIFGAAIEFYLEGAAGDWLIGEDITVSAPALRSMENPNSTGDPDTYFGNFWAPLSATPNSGNDFGGVHTNSGVQNYWFYLLSEGGSGVNDHGVSYSVTGIGLDDASQIAYRNLTVYLTPSSKYADARASSINAATDLFGDPSPQLQAVKDAWDAVGVYAPLSQGVLVWEGQLGGQDYSGAYMASYLANAGYTVDYTSTFPATLIGYDAVFLSFGNFGASGSNTVFNAGMASAVTDYLLSGGKVYLEGGDALGFDQMANTTLLNLFGLSSASDGPVGPTPVSNLAGQPGALTEGMLFISSTQINNHYIDLYTPGNGALAFVRTGYGNVAVQNAGFFGQNTFCFSYALSRLTDGASPSTKDDLMAAIIDFLLPLPPEIGVSPDSLLFTVPIGGSGVGSITISNTGAGDLIWSLREQNVLLFDLNGKEKPRPAAKPARETLTNQAESDKGPINRKAGLQALSPISAQYPSDNLPSVARPEIYPIYASQENLLNGVGLVLDDGTRENAIGLTNGGQFIWLNRFTPLTADFPFKLEEIWVMFPAGQGISVGQLIDIYVYEDTDGDGNPGTGASLVGSVANAAVQAVDDVTFSVYTIGPLTLNGPGDIIIAVVNRTAGISAGTFVAALDQTSSAGRSWIGTYTIGNPPNPPPLPATYLWGTIDSFGFPGNWMIRGFGTQASDCPWLAASPTSGVIFPGGSKTVDVAVDAQGLAPGAYECRLVILSNDPDENSISIPVTLIVEDDCEFAATLSVSDNCAASQLLRFGTCPQASNGFDPFFDQYAPPPPPTGAFDARFRIEGDDYLKDFRASNTGAITWDVHYQETAGCAPATLGWDNSEFPPAGSFRLVDAATSGSLVDVDMRASNTYIDNLNIGHLQIIYSLGEVFSMHIRSGWNMLGLPFAVPDGHYRILFPNAVTGTLFGFDGSYFSTDTLKLCNGYWLRFPGAESVPLTGNAILSCEIELETGWNLVAGPSCDVAVTNIDDPGGIIIPNTVFGFDGAYFIADTMLQGNSYWIKTSAAGTITLSCGAMLAKRTSIATARLGEFDNVSSLQIGDASGARQTLYFNVELHDEDVKQTYSMPPLPPPGSFDARFEGDYRLTTAEEALIYLQVSRYPVSVSAANLPVIENAFTGSGYQYILQELVNGEVAGTHVLKEGLTITIADTRIKTLKLAKERRVPTEFMVLQNYPNPFNPVTTIHYAIPQAERVEIVIFNTLGQRVRTLLSEDKEAGYFSVEWNGINDNGHQVASGLYIFQVKAGRHHAIKKMILLK